MINPLRDLYRLILKGPGKGEPKAMPPAGEETAFAWGAVDFYTAEEGEWVTFPMRTADSRQWRVRAEWAALEELAGRGDMTSAEVERILRTHVHVFEIAALGRIGRGETEGDLILLTVSDLRA